mmetsp:Transcript_37613/g.73484  ORF Transcript_37613/g.73484 Transcript_37613/m.73484 type:complete len:254 (-) Transcript_37613:242-1003(-)
MLASNKLGAAPPGPGAELLQQPAQKASVCRHRDLLHRHHVAPRLVHHLHQVACALHLVGAQVTPLCVRRPVSFDVESRQPHLQLAHWVRLVNMQLQVLVQRHVHHLVRRRLRQALVPPLWVIHHDRPVLLEPPEPRRARVLAWAHVPWVAKFVLDAGPASHVAILVGLTHRVLGYVPPVFREENRHSWVLVWSGAVWSVGRQDHRRPPVPVGGLFVDDLIPPLKPGTKPSLALLSRCSGFDPDSPDARTGRRD